MTTFDDRDKGFESKFAHDEELSFKVTALCNKLLGLWAAAKLGKTGPAAEQYTKHVVETDVESSDNDIIAHLLRDLTAAGITITHKEISAEMDRLFVIARKQITGEEQEA